MVVAAEVALAMHADLDALVVRKAGVPWQPELALGAVTASGDRVVNDDVIARSRITDAQAAAAFDQARAEAGLRDHRLRGGRPPPRLGGRLVVIVDDGIATGATVRAATHLLARTAPRPGRIVVAVPVAPADTVATLVLSGAVDAMIVLEQPARFDAVGAWFDDFSQVSDGEVRALLTG